MSDRRYVLQYRLLDEEDNYPLLFEYRDIDIHSVISRMLCDYLIKDNSVYEKHSAAREGQSVVIYVTQENTNINNSNESYMQVRHKIIVEIRKYDESSDDNFPLLENVEVPDMVEAIVWLSSEYFQISGIEWGKSSCEFDEDRNRYVIYVVLPAEVV